MFKLSYTYAGNRHKIEFDLPSDAIRFYYNLFLNLANENIILTDQHGIVICRAG